MKIKKCFFGDDGRLAELNKQLIEDEKSDNHMDMEELKSRMETFLRTDYNAYFFLEENEVDLVLLDINLGLHGKHVHTAV